MLTPAGTKLFDFGLAKHDTGPAVQALSMLATAPGTATAQGTIIGTVQYMAPEQVQGAPADARTDIFAFGSVLYEMATGRRAFEATTQASLIAKILETEPPALAALAPLAPPALDHVVQGCLAKSRSDRWQTAHDVKLYLQGIQTQGFVIEQSRSGWLRRRNRAWVPWTVAAALLGALAATWLMQWPRSVPHAVARLTVSVPADEEVDTLLPALAVSPDGAHLVYVAKRGEVYQLHLRSIHSVESETLRGTEGAAVPIFSPDSQWIGFFADGKLKRIPVTGGASQIVCHAPEAFGASCARNDIIYFAPGSFSGLSAGARHRWCASALHDVARSGDQSSMATGPPKWRGGAVYISHWPRV
jgi:hypothetical protein